MMSPDNVVIAEIMASIIKNHVRIGATKTERVDGGSS